MRDARELFKRCTSGSTKLSGVFTAQMGGAAHRKGLAMLVVALVLMSACSPGGSSESFDGVLDLIKALRAGGVGCTQAKVFERAENDTSEAGRCYAPGGYEVDIYVTSDEELVAQGVESLGSIYDHEILVGPNWYLTTGHGPLTEEIADAIGGEIVLPGADDASSTDEPSKPNVLLVITDDQRANGTLQVMPYVRRLFWDEGIRFTQAVATTPLCCPSRSSMFSGRYAHSHGVRTNYVTDRLEQSKTLQAILQRAGYRTAVAGKYLNRWPPDVDPPHFDRWAIPLEVGYREIPFNVEGELETIVGYTNDFVRTKALEYLDGFERDDETPWLLVVGTPAAHALYEPEPRYMDAELPPWHGNRATHEKDLSDKPPFIARADERYGARRVHRLQLRTLMSADDLVGSLFDRMEQHDETGDTLAVFVSDNGQLWGDHGVTGKRAPYLGSVRVPLMVRLPAGGEAGTADPRLAATLDVAPTVLDVAGLRRPPWMEGRSLLGQHERDRVLLEHWGDLDTSIPDWASTLTDRYQYVEYYGPTGRVSFREFYDLRRDPWQLENVLADGSEANDPDLDHLERVLGADRTCTGAACP